MADHPEGQAMSMLVARDFICRACAPKVSTSYWLEYIHTSRVKVSLVCCDSPERNHPRYSTSCKEERAWSKDRGRHLSSSSSRPWWPGVKCGRPNCQSPTALHRSQGVPDWHGPGAAVKGQGRARALLPVNGARVGRRAASGAPSCLSSVQCSVKGH